MGNIIRLEFMRAYSIRQELWKKTKRVNAKRKRKVVARDTKFKTGY